LALIVTI